MKKSLVFNIQDSTLQVELFSDYPTKEQVILCTVTNLDFQSFTHLWGIIQCSHAAIRQQDAKVGAPNCTTYYQPLINNEGHYVLEYETSHINRLIQLFTLIKIWLEINHGNSVLDLRLLY